MQARNVHCSLLRRNLDTRNPVLVVKRIRRTEDGRVVCRAENGVGNPASESKAIRVYCESLACGL